MWLSRATGGPATEQKTLIQLNAEERDRERQRERKQQLTVSVDHAKIKTET